MNTPDIVGQIDATVAARSILTHPFYQAWQRGELGPSALQDYAGQYYHHVAAFPTYLSALHAHTPDSETRRVLLENLIDEERGDDNHPELWLRFADAVGCRRRDVVLSSARPETSRFVDGFRSLCASGSVARGVAALYAYESQVPAVSETKIDGLVRFYGVDDSRGLSYFTVHKDADVLHSEQERALLRRHVGADVHAAGECIAAAERIVSGLWGVLSGVCERNGLAA